ncbi:MAG: hypothetical protein GYB36_10935 [Alphaproteobacteria bacterium]|nr:hypothetical protein [Alphaproteobacteria bacterium]
MRGSILAFVAAVAAAGAYVASGQNEDDTTQNLVPESYVQEAQRQVDTFMSWLRDDASQPDEPLLFEDDREDIL